MLYVFIIFIGNLDVDILSVVISQFEAKATSLLGYCIESFYYALKMNLHVSAMRIFIRFLRM